MNIRKLVATAVFAIAATGITTAMANGQAGVASDLRINAAEGPIAYTTTLAADHSGALVTLASGKFSLAPGAVTVTDGNGAVVGAIPTTLRMQSGETFAVRPTLNATDTALTLTPVGGPTAAAISSNMLPGMHQAHGDGGSIVVGAVIGCVVGILIGIWFFLVGAIVGCAVGAVIGGLIGAAV